LVTNGQARLKDSITLDFMIKKIGLNIPALNAVKSKLKMWNNMERIGKIFCDEKVISEGHIPDFFNRIKFTPVGVEYLKSVGIYEYIGYSPYFEPIPDESPALEYKIIFTKHYISQCSNDSDISVRVEPREGL